MPDGSCVADCPQDMGLMMMYERSACECPHGSWPDVNCTESSDGHKHCEYHGCKCHGGAKMVSGHCQCEDTSMMLTMAGCKKDKVMHE